MTVYVWSGGAYQESRVAGPHHFNADQDPALADPHPDLAFYFDVDPVPDPHISDGNLRQLV